MGDGPTRSFRVRYASDEQRSQTTMVGVRRPKSGSHSFASPWLPANRTSRIWPPMRTLSSC